MKEDKLASIKELESLKETTSNQITNLQAVAASLRSELDKTNSDKANAIEAANQASSKLKEDKLASIKELESLKETTSNQITNLQTINASLRSELDKTKTDKANAIETAARAENIIHNLKLTTAKEVASLENESKKEIDNHKNKTALLEKELQEKNINNAKFTKKLKDTVVFLRKELDQIKSEKSGEDKTRNQNSINKKIETLAQSNKVKNTNESNDNKTQNLHSKIKTLRTVLQKFQAEKIKSTEETKLINKTIETERIINKKIIADLKKEATTLKLKLDKINLAQIKKTTTLNRSNQTDQLTSTNKLNLLRQEREKELAKLRSTNQTLRQELAEFKAKKIKTNQAKTFLSSNKKPQVASNLIKSKQQKKGSSQFSPQEIITSSLFTWANAWENKNTGLYFSFYSGNFKDPKRSYSAWKNHRQRSINRASNISISIAKIKIDKLKNNTIRVTFTQKYKSNKTSDVGIKQLLWKKEKSKWKILKETWRPR